MNAPARKLYARASLLDFPAITVGGSVRDGASSWWAWIASAPPAEIEAGHRALDDFAARLATRTRRHLESLGEPDAAAAAQVAALAAEQPASELEADELPEAEREEAAGA